MFCVVMMHTVSENTNYIFKLIQVGCMAYFFFCSGFLFNVENCHTNTLKYIAKNIKSLLIPYFVCATLGALSVYLWPSWYEGVTASDIFRCTFITCAPVGYGIVWFLISLFTIKIIFFLLWKIIHKIHNKKVIVIVLLGILILCGYLTHRFIEYNSVVSTRVNYNLDISIVALMFYIMGFLFRYLDLNKIFSTKKVSIAILIITRIICSYIELNIITSTNIYEFNFGNNFYIYFINQILAILSFLAIGNVLKDVKMLNHFGRHNMIIYLSHSYILWFVEKFFGRYIWELRYQFYTWGESLLIATIAYLITIIVSEILRRVIIFIKNS